PARLRRPILATPLIQLARPAETHLPVLPAQPCGSQQQGSKHTLLVDRPGVPLAIRTAEANDSDHKQILPLISLRFGAHYRARDARDGLDYLGSFDGGWWP